LCSFSGLHRIVRLIFRFKIHRLRICFSLDFALILPYNINVDQSEAGQRDIKKQPDNPCSRNREQQKAEY